MDSCEGGGGGGRGEGEERTTASPSLSPVVSLDVGWSSRTSASAPAKEPLTQPEPEPEQGGAEGSEAREDTQGGELTKGGGHKREDGQSSEEEEKETDKEEVFADEGEEAVCIGPHSRRDGGEDQEEEEEEAISNQSQTKSKCSLLPQQSQHSSSSSTVMANGTHYRKIPTSPKPRPSLSLSPELSLSPTTSPKLSLSPATSPKLSSSPSTSPKHFTHTSSSPSLLSQAEFRDTPSGDQGCTPGFPQSFKSQQSALAFPLTAPESTSMYAEEGGAAGVTQTSIANGDVAKAPEPNDSQGESEVDEERSKERDDAVLQNLQQDLSPNSLSSHMTLMHSRNSCKTLKCPKCNWHYKSQHTLQAHMKEKHPETEGQCVCDGSEGKCVCGGNRDTCLFCSSGQSHPRLARGETYACGYKPFRCEVCDYATSSKGNLSIHMQSDKHLNNVQAGGHANGHSLAQAEQITHNCGPSNGYTTEDQAFKHTHHAVTPPAKHATPSPTNSVGKRWRCDVCDYETSIARNLRIHTTSEKHTHNMMRLQRGYYLSHCRSLTPQLTQLKHLNGTGGELSLTMRLSSQQVPELTAPLGSALTPSPSPSPSPPPPPPLPLSPTPSLSQAALQCLVCVSFSSDRMEALEQHLSAPRSLPQSEWCSLVAGGCHCRLCGYTTPLRANFSLHCQTDRHRSRYQLAAHIREGGATGQEEANLVAKGNPIQLRCNLCDHVTNSVEKLRAHCLSSHHEARQRVYKFLQKFDSAVEEGSWLLHCLPCNFSSPSKLHLTRHAHSAAHQQKEGLLGRSSPTEGGLMAGDELAAIFTIRKCSTPDAGDLNDVEDSSEDSNYLSDKTKDTVTWGERWAAKETDDTSGEDGERRDSVPPVKRRSPGSDEIESPFLPKRPRMHQHTAHQQLAQCPLCQVKLAHAHLRHHLTHLHSVAQDCVDKLISTVLPLPEQFEGLVLPEQEPQQQNPENASNTKDSSLQNNGTLMEDLDSTTPKLVPSLLTPPLEEQLSAEPDTPNGHAQSLSPLLPHSPPSPQGDLTLSDRHGYKFRCSKCSLAFPTREKLQVHWQYHAMRAATECPLCSRQCRSQEALQRHLNNTHSPQETALWQNALLERGQADQEKSTGSLQPPATAQDEGEDEALEDGGEGMSRESTVEPIREVVGEDTMEDEVEKEDRPLELAGKSGLGASEPGSVAPQQEESGLEPSHILPPRRSSSSTIERYMDPSRPYKCSVCSESFTQKTILLVHYNSVSHLHRARRAQQDSGPQQADAPRGSDPRPYRCKVCGVGYSQSSTLDIHLRSVLHQSRARAAQTQAPQPSAQTPAQLLVPAATASPLSRGGEESSRGLGPASPSLSSLAGPSSRGDSHRRLSGQAESLQAKRRVADLLATRSQQTLMLLQQQQQLAQAQAQLQQHTNLLQSQIFNPALLKHFSLGPEALMKQHFSITPDSLLSLQQQLLLPFYLSGELNLSPDFTAKGPETGKTAFTSSPETEQPRGEAKKDAPAPAPNPTEPPQELPCEAAADSSFTTNQSHGAPNPGEEGGEGGKDHLPVKTEKDPEEAEAIVSHLSSSVSHRDSCPPPRVPYAAVSGGAFRALLGSFGYELALQYTQGTQRHQQKSPAQPQAGGQENSDNVQLEQQSEVDLKRSQMENGDTERCPEENKEAANSEVKGRLEERECGECGKLFSDFLVLKSHQEYVHKLLLPPTMLESFSRQYRMTYDRLYPLTHTVSVEKAASPTPDPETATSPPKLQSHPAPASTPFPAKALTPAPAPARPSPPPSPSQPECFPQQEAAVPSVPSPPAPQPNSSIPLPLLPLPSLSLPSIPLSVPPMPFHIDLPLLSPAMMQSMALQSQAMLSTMDPGLNSDLTKFYQSQLSPVLLGQQSQLSPALLGQQPQLSPALLGQQPQLSPGLSGPSKRARTRISEEQLNVLRQHFSISSLPSDEQINKMAALSALPHKVIKHWFRNTLFKERQRDKDSPYNFSNPPTIPLEKTGEEPSALSQYDPPQTQSPAPPAQHPPQPQRQETHRGEHHRSRRSSRTRFTEQQLETLQGVFEASPYPREEEYDRLSALLSLPNRVIVVWFQNARQRARKTQEKGSEGGREERPDEGANRKRGDGTQSQRGRRRKRDQSDDEDDDEGHCDSQNENSMDLAYEYYTHSDSPSNTPVPSDPQATPHHADKESTRVESSHPRDVDFKTPSTSTKTREVEGEGPDSEIQSQTRETPLDKHPKTPVLSSDFSPHKPSTTSHFGSQSSPTAPQRSTPAPAPVSPNSPPPPAPAKFLPPPGSPTDSHQPQTKAHPQTKAQAHPQFQCSLCPISLPSFQLWQEHQTRHLLAAQSQVQLLHPGFTDRPPLPYMLLHPSQNFLTSQLLSGAMSQMHPSHTHPMMSHMSNAHANLPHNSHALANLPHPSLPSPKQGSKVSPEVRQGCEAGSREREDDQRRDKRQRTTITPEQLEVLYQRYSLDSNPTRGVLEGIARDVGLGRRVVQVWFQNTRARERKGQFRSLGAGAGLSLSHNHLRCPFCRALFKVRSALDAHVRSRHGAEAERVGYSLPMGAAPLGNFGDLSSYAYRERQCSSMSPFLPSSSGAIATTRDQESGNAALTSDSLAFDLNNQEGEEEDEEEAEEGVEEEYGCEEGSSLADPASPSPEASGAASSVWGDKPAQRHHHHHQQQRQRTHMSHLQVLQLRAFYRNHRTPSRLECEALGQDLGLARRVVQVWFQNARAKEKRARSLSNEAATGERDQMELTARAGERDRA